MVGVQCNHRWGVRGRWAAVGACFTLYRVTGTLPDTVDVEDIPKRLDRLAAGINASALRVEDHREQWVQAVTTWLRDRA